MLATTEFEELSYDPATFFASFWRRKPLFVRGGAASFLSRNWSDDDFERAYAAAQAQGDSIMEHEGEVTFIENVSAFDADLAERAVRFSQEFGTPQAWFDTVRTYAPSGIGGHFDHSDNFVLQQNGVKHWTLADPTHVSRADIAKRMLNIPGVGSQELPEGESVMFVVEPGDLLYIPLFWLHHGVSKAASLSLSLVCPAVSLYAAVIPFLNQAIKERAIGHEPIAALHAHLSMADRSVALAQIRQATTDMLNRVSDDEIVTLVQSMQARRLPGALA